MPSSAQSPTIHPHSFSHGHGREIACSPSIDIDSTRLLAIISVCLASLDPFGVRCGYLQCDRRISFSHLVCRSLCLSDMFAQLVVKFHRSLSNTHPCKLFPSSLVHSLSILSCLLSYLLSSSSSSSLNGWQALECERFEFLDRSFHLVIESIEFHSPHSYTHPCTQPQHRCKYPSRRVPASDIGCVEHGCHGALLHLFDTRHRGGPLQPPATECHFGDCNEFEGGATHLRSMVDSAVRSIARAFADA